MDRTWGLLSQFVFPTFSAVDTMLSFVFEGAQISESLQPFPNLISILERYHERPAYKVALEKGGEYKLG